MDQPTDSAERILQAFQASPNELQRTFKDACALLRSEMLHSQQESYHLISEKIKTSSATKWKREGNQKQFEFNADVLEILVKATQACKAGDVSTTNVHIESATRKISNRQKLIRMADSTEGGWQTVKEYEGNDLASNSEDEKRINHARSI